MTRARARLAAVLALVVIAVVLALTSCDALTGTRPKVGNCRILPTFDTLRVWIGPRGRVDSVLTQETVYEHITGEPCVRPPRPGRDTVYTSVYTASATPSRATARGGR